MKNLAPVDDAEDVSTNTLTVTFVNHGSTSSVARPANAGCVIWKGSVAPTNADTSKDFWADTS